MPQGTNLDPLGAVKVLDVSTILAGSIQLHGDHGADFIKIERPKHGDPLRTHGHSKGDPAVVKIVSRNKRNVRLCRGEPNDSALFRELALPADLVAEYFWPDKLGIVWSGE